MTSTVPLTECSFLDIRNAYTHSGLAPYMATPTVSFSLSSSLRGKEFTDGTSVPTAPTKLSTDDFIGKTFKNRTALLTTLVSGYPPDSGPIYPDSGWSPGYVAIYHDFANGGNTMLQNIAQTYENGINQFATGALWGAEIAAHWRMSQSGHNWPTPPSGAPPSWPFLTSSPDPVQFTTVATPSGASTDSYWFFSTGTSTTSGASWIGNSALNNNGGTPNIVWTYVP